MLEVRAFGKLQFSHAATVVDHFPTRHVEELFGYLLLRPQVRHPREKLVSLLWPDVSAKRGRPRLSVALSRLRGLFLAANTPFEAYVDTTTNWVALRPERPLSFDRDQFITNCTTGLRTDDPVRKQALLKTAVSLYRADLMEGIYTNWCIIEREKLSWLRSQALGELMHGSMARNQFEDALRYGQIILAEEPLREDAHRALMQSYAALGRHDRATRQYKTCQHLLKAELDEPPMYETTRLYRHLLETRVSHLLDDPTLAAQRQTAIKAALSALQNAADHLDSLLF